MPRHRTGYEPAPDPAGRSGGWIERAGMGSHETGPLIVGSARFPTYPGGFRAETLITRPKVPAIPPRVPAPPEHVLVNPAR